jgi:hypothetical protein
VSSPEWAKAPHNVKLFGMSGDWQSDGTGHSRSSGYLLSARRSEDQRIPFRLKVLGRLEDDPGKDLNCRLTEVRLGMIMAHRSCTDDCNTTTTMWVIPNDGAEKLEEWPRSTRGCGWEYGTGYQSGGNGVGVAGSEKARRGVPEQAINSLLGRTRRAEVQGR